MWFSWGSVRTVAPTIWLQQLQVLRCGICEGQAAVTHIQTGEAQSCLDGDGVDLAEQSVNGGHQGGLEIGGLPVPAGHAQGGQAHHGLWIEVGDDGNDSVAAPGP